MSTRQRRIAHEMVEICGTVFVLANLPHFFTEIEAKSVHKKLKGFFLLNIVVSFILD